MNHFWRLHIIVLNDIFQLSQKPFKIFRNDPRKQIAFFNFIFNKRRHQRSRANGYRRWRWKVFFLPSSFFLSLYKQAILTTNEEPAHSFFPPNPLGEEVGGGEKILRAVCSPSLVDFFFVVLPWREDICHWRRRLVPFVRCFSRANSTKGAGVRAILSSTLFGTRCGINPADKSWPSANFCIILFSFLKVETTT